MTRTGDIALYAIAGNCCRPLVFHEDTWQEIEANLTASAGTIVSVYMVSEPWLEQVLRESAESACLRGGDPVGRRGHEPAASVVSGTTAACPEALWWETRTGEDRIVVVIRGGRPVDRDGLARRLRAALGRWRFHEGDIGPAGTVFEVLERNGESIAIAESCTGGWVSKMLTDIAGSSAVFKGGCVSYSNESKTDLIGVDASIIERKGAVSEQVVKAMARGAARVFAADYGIGISGIAGPAGATPEKPLGTVWIAIAGRRHTVISRRFRFFGSRDSVRRKASIAALIMARQFASGHGELDIPKMW